MPMRSPCKRTMIAGTVLALLVTVLVTGILAPGASADPGWRKIEQRIVELTNAERASRNLGTLAPVSRLARVARDHSQEMASLDYFSHESPTEGRHSPTDRLRQAGIAYSWSGENIAYYQGYAADRLASLVVADWMRSPGHRANILNPHFTCIGVGAASQGDKVYFTQVFMAPQR